MVEMRYHQAVLDLLGMKLDASPRRLAIIEEREAACARRFPASVREWFSFESAETLFCENTNEDNLQELTELGDPLETAQGFLKIATENQGVVAWYVRLDAGDDPPVYDNNDEWNEDLSSTSWREVSKTFTNFIFDMIASRHFAGWFSGLSLSAIDQQPSLDELRQLRSWFQEGPVTDEADSKVYRFFTRDLLVTVRSVTPEHVSSLKAEWLVESVSAEALFEFGKKLWRIGTLSQTLKAESSAPAGLSVGDQVLQRLRDRAGS